MRAGDGVGVGGGPAVRGAFQAVGGVGSAGVLERAVDGR